MAGCLGVVDWLFWSQKAIISHILPKILAIFLLISTNLAIIFLNSSKILAGAAQAHLYFT